MSLAALFLGICFIIFGLVAYYFNVQRRAVQDQERMNLELLEDDQRERESLQEEKKEAEEKATFIVRESEEIANEIITELQNLIGITSGPEFSLPSGQNFEAELVTIKAKIKDQYKSRIEEVLRRFEAYQMQKARNIESFAEHEQETTDINLQKIRMEMLEKTRKRMEDYKNQEIELFNQKVKKVVDEAAQDFFGRALTNSEHEELIIDAVRKAREKNGI
jgi:cbb3-type cytochrome oxidase subunit 3